MFLLVSTISKWHLFLVASQFIPGNLGFDNVKRFNMVGIMCGGIVNMTEEGLHAGEILLDSKSLSGALTECVFTVLPHSSPPWNRIAYKIREYHNKAKDSCFALKAYSKEATTGATGHKYCGSNFPQTRKWSKLEQNQGLRLIYTSGKHREKTVVKLLFNLFSSGEQCNGQRCHDGLCIPEHLKCRGFCKGESGCASATVSFAKIVGVSVGVIASLILVVFLVWHCMRWSESEAAFESVEEINKAVSTVINTALVVHCTTPTEPLLTAAERNVNADNKHMSHIEIHSYDDDKVMPPDCKQATS